MNWLMLWLNGGLKKKRKEEEDKRELIERLISGNDSCMWIWGDLIASNLSWDETIPLMFGIIEGKRIKDEL